MKIGLCSKGEIPFILCVHSNNNDVLNSINHIKSNAIGSDKICFKFVKLLLPAILPYIPNAWKTAIVVPIPKINNPDTLDYRPISILPALSKAFEYFKHKQLCEHLVSRYLLYKHQSGFRTLHSSYFKSIAKPS